MGFNGVLAALGVWWLALFNRSSSKAYFDVPGTASRAREAAEHQRDRVVPLIGAAFMIIAAILRSPAMLFGIILTGWLALVVYAALAAVQMYLGTGLLHLHEKARIAAIVYFCFGCVNLVVSLVGPGYAKIMSQMQAAMPRYLPAGVPAGTCRADWLLVLPTVACYAVLIYFLVRRRAVFH